MPDLGTRRCNLKTIWYLYLAVLSQRQLRMFYPIGKSLHVIHVSSVILESDFLMKDLVIAPFIFSFYFNFFYLKVSDSDSHSWYVTEVLYLRGSAKLSRGFVGFFCFLRNDLIDRQLFFLKYHYSTCTYIPFVSVRVKLLWEEEDVWKKACNVLFSKRKN